MTNILPKKSDGLTKKEIMKILGNKYEWKKDDIQISTVSEKKDGNN